MSRLMLDEVNALDGLYNENRLRAGSPKIYLLRRRQLLQTKHSLETKQEELASTRKITPQYIMLRQTLLTQKFGEPSMNLTNTTLSRSSASSKRALSQDKSSLSISTKSPYMDDGDLQIPSASVSTMDLNPAYGAYSFTNGKYFFSHHKQSISVVRFANHSLTRLALGSLDGTASICSVRSEPEPATVLIGHEKGITDLQWSANNELLITTSFDATIRLWHVEKGILVRTMTDRSPVLCCLFNPENNNLFVVGTKLGDVKVYNLSTGKAVPDGVINIGGATTAVAFDPLGRLLFVANDRGEVLVFAFAPGHGHFSRLYKASVTINYVAVCSLAVAPSFAKETHEPCLLVSAKDNLVKVFGIGSFLKRRNSTASPARLNTLSTQIKNMPLQFRLTLQAQFPIKHQIHNIQAVFCPLLSMKQGPCFVTGTETNTVQIFRALPGKLLNTLSAHEAPVLSVCWNKDETLLASGDLGGTVIVWRIT